MLKKIVRSFRRFAGASTASRVIESTSPPDGLAPSGYVPNVYGDDIPWEIPVQLNLRDVLKCGDCALDVGANIGGVAVAMSRMVGPAGSVHAFEANPTTLPRLRADLAANQAANVIVVPKAAWSVSDTTIPFYCDNSYYAAASSVQRRDPSWQEVRVPTVTLDDYCRANRLVPRAIKLDVEGAEFDVLQGARWLLDHHAPSWVMEYYPPATVDRDPLELLRGHGYTIYDSNLYRPVDREFYLSQFSRVPMANLLALGPASAASVQYRQIALTEVLVSDLRDGSIRSDAIPLRQPGRYIISADFEGPPQVVAGLRVADSSGRSLAYFEARLEHLQEHSCSRMVIDIERPIDVHCELSCQQAVALQLREVKAIHVQFPTPSISAAA